MAPRVGPMSRRKYAEHRGVDESSVRLAIRTGRIPVRPDGLIDPVAADRAWDASTNVTKPRNSVTGNPRHRRLEGEGKTPMGAELEGAPGMSQDPEIASMRRSLVASHAAAMALKVRRERLALEREEGKLVDVDAVSALAFATSRRSRDMVLSLEDRLARELGLDEAQRKIVRREVRQVAEQISQKVAVNGKPQA